MITIHGRPNSINVQKAMWAVGETGIAHERLDVGGPFGGNDTPEYRAMNPNGLVPVLVDGGTVIWESHAIVRYLGAVHDVGGLWPADPAERSVADRWMDWAHASLNLPMVTVFWGMIRTPEADRDMDAIHRAAEALHSVWGILEGQLAGRDFVAGGRLTMGDIPVGAMFCRYRRLPAIDQAVLPNCDAWLARLSERPAFAEHVAGIPLT